MKKGLLAFGGGLVLMFVVAEVGFRQLAPSKGIDVDSYERLGTHAWSGEGEFVPHAYSVFVRPPSSDRRDMIGLGEDRRFKKGEYPRILCLGGSTTEGGNSAGLMGSYPSMLLTSLEEESRVKAEVLNGGVAGWTTAETMSAYFLDYQDFLPDIVLIHHAVNDTEPMIATGFRVDYSHWRRPMETPQLSLLERALLRWSRLYAHLSGAEKRFSLDQTKVNHGWGTLPASEPNSQELVERIFARNIETIGRAAESNGSNVALMTMPFSRDLLRDDLAQATSTNNQILREVAARHSWLLVDLDGDFESKQGEQKVQVRAAFLDGVHLTPEGNLFKANYIAQQLLESGLLTPNLGPAPATGESGEQR